MDKDAIYLGFLIGVLVIPVVAGLAVAGMAIEEKIKDWFDMRKKNYQLEKRVTQYQGELDELNKQLQELEKKLEELNGGE